MSIKSIINAQTDETLANLNKRFFDQKIDFSKILSTNLLSFVQSYATSNGTNVGYVIPSILTTINFLAAKKCCKVEIHDGYFANLNTLLIFVGQPSTGKSPALKCAVTRPLENTEITDCIISNSTASGFTKLL